VLSFRIVQPLPATPLLFSISVSSLIEMRHIFMYMFNNSGQQGIGILHGKSRRLHLYLGAFRM
jgi:hypothetical protein